MEIFGDKGCCELMNTENQEVSDAASFFVQRILNALSGMDRKEEKKPDADLCQSMQKNFANVFFSFYSLFEKMMPKNCLENRIELIRIGFELKSMLTNPKVCAIGRNNAIDMLSKNLMHMDGGLPRGWSWQFIEEDGLLKFFIY